VRLTLHPGDVLRIPAGSEHWFQLTPLHQLKAVRLFSFVDHWVTTPTDRAIAPSLAA
jgi:1,2-dihydroxy-3-keto-5-methylthiopentene dioxygenase